MADEQLNLILRLKDEATSQLSSIRNQVTAAAAAMAAGGLAMGAAWEASRDKIIAASGATGDKLAGLQADVRALAQGGWGLEESTTAIIEVNRHLGLTAAEAQDVGNALLQSGADAGKFSTAAQQLGLDAEGAKKFLDQLTVASQKSGVSIDDMSDEIVDRAGDWDEGGASMEHLAETVVQAALEFGKGGLETSLGLASEMVTKGMIPAVESLDTLLGDTTGSVESAAAASRTWRDDIRKAKDAVIATIAPYGDMIGGIGAATAGFLQLIPAIQGSAAAQGVLNFVMSLNPIGLIVVALAAAGAAAWYFRDEIVGAFKGVLTYVQPWVDTFLSYVETAVGWIPKVGDKLSAMVGTARTKLGEFTTVAEESGEGAGEGFVEAFSGPVLDPVTGTAPSLVASIIAAEEDAKAEAASVGESTGEAFLSSLNASTRTRGQMLLGVRDALRSQGQEWVVLSDTIDMQTARAEQSVYDMFETIEQNASAAGANTGGGFMSKLTGILGGGAGGSGIMGFFNETLGGVSGILSQFLNGDWKSTLGSMVSMGLNTLVPGLGTIANQAFDAFKKVFDWFKKPSETEIAARETWASIESTVVDTLRGTQEFSNEVDRAMADGWDQSTAEMRAAFVLLGQQAGQTYDESFESYAAYEQAVRDGDVELAEQMMASLQSLAEEHGVTWATNVDTTSAATSAIQGSIDAVKGKDVKINVSHHTTYTSSGSSAAPSGGKKHTGGPVSAGVSYETIPGEVFVPRTDGTVINPGLNNPGLIDYERLGAAVARAVAASPPTIAQNPVTDAILRNMPRREALRGWAPA